MLCGAQRWWHVVREHNREQLRMMHAPAWSPFAWRPSTHTPIHPRRGSAPSAAAAAIAACCTIIIDAFLEGAPGLVGPPAPELDSIEGRFAGADGDGGCCAAAGSSCGFRTSSVTSTESPAPAFSTFQRRFPTVAARLRSTCAEGGLQCE